MILIFGWRDQEKGGLKFQGPTHCWLLGSGSEGRGTAVGFQRQAEAFSQSGSGGAAMAGKEILHKVKDKVTQNGRGWGLLLVLSYGFLFLATSN